MGSSSCYDAARNVPSYATATLTYNDRGRAKTVQNGSVTENLVYNAIGQMVQTSGGPIGTVLYYYDEAGHLLGEYSSTGARVRMAEMIVELRKRQPIRVIRRTFGKLRNLWR